MQIGKPYARSKAAGEVAVKKAYQLVVLRPSVILGHVTIFSIGLQYGYDYAGAALPGGGGMKMQPVYVDVWRVRCGRAWYRVAICQWAKS